MRLPPPLRIALIAVGGHCGHWLSESCSSSGAARVALCLTGAALEVVAAVVVVQSVFSFVQAIARLLPPVVQFKGAPSWRPGALIGGGASRVGATSWRALIPIVAMCVFAPRSRGQGVAHLRR
jgi:hypothetical protein